MIFIVEGPDGSGKTSLINSIRADKQRYCHFIARANAATADFELMQRENEWINKAPHDLTVFMDRHFLVSGPIYSGVLRNTSFIPDEYKLKPKPLTQPDSAFIYCRPPNGTIIENVSHGKSPQLNGVAANIDRIIEAYDSIFRAISRKSLVLRFDYTKTRTQTFINEIFKTNKPAKLNG